MLDAIVNIYNNTVHKTIKMNYRIPMIIPMLNTMKILIKKDPKFKVGDHVKTSKYKNIFAEGYTPNCSEKVFVVSKIKNSVPWIYVVSDLNGKEITGSFYEKNFFSSQKNLEQKKYLKEKVINCTSNGKGIIVVLINGLIKKISYLPKIH